MNYILAGMVAVIIATFFHDETAWLFRLSAGGEVQFTFLGIVFGGVFAGVGVLIAALGLLQGAVVSDRSVRLIPVLLLLFSALMLFFILFYSTLTSPEPPRLRPGETITI